MSTLFNELKNTYVKHFTGGGQWVGGRALYKYEGNTPIPRGNALIKANAVT